MPPIETRDRHEDALWFPESDQKTRYGEPLRGDPVAIMVRSVEGAAGQRFGGADAPVSDFTLIVDRRMDAGWVYFGTLAEWNSAGSGSEEGALLVITSYKETPDVKGRRFRRVVTVAYNKEASPDEGA